MEFKKGGSMKKFILIISLVLTTMLLSSCIALPDGHGGTYVYPIGDDEIEYKRPDGSKMTVNQDGTIKQKR